MVMIEEREQREPSSGAFDHMRFCCAAGRGVGVYARPPLAERQPFYARIGVHGHRLGGYRVGFD
jgi:hypothetical protein